MVWLWTVRTTHTRLAYAGSRDNDARDFIIPVMHTDSRARQRRTGTYPARGRPLMDHDKFFLVSPVPMTKDVALTSMVPSCLWREKEGSSGVASCENQKRQGNRRGVTLVVDGTHM